MVSIQKLVQIVKNARNVKGIPIVLGPKIKSKRAKNLIVDEYV